MNEKGLGKSSNMVEASYVEEQPLEASAFWSLLKKWPEVSKSQLNLGRDVRRQASFVQKEIWEDDD